MLYMPRNVEENMDTESRGTEDAGKTCMELPEVKMKKQKHAREDLKRVRHCRRKDHLMGT